MAPGRSVNEYELVLKGDGRASIKRTDVCRSVVSLYNTNGNTNNIGIIMREGGASGSGGVDLNYRANTGAEFTNYGADTSFVSTFFPVSQAILVHLELNGSGTGYFYINSNLVWSGTIGVSTLSTQTLRIGIYMDDASYTATEQVQNIAVYSARLTTAQKQANMSAVLRR